MTDRIHALTVILERDVRDDDLQPLVGLIVGFILCIAVDLLLTSNAIGRHFGW